MAQPTPTDAKSDLPQSINRLVFRDSGATSYGQQIRWTDYAGVEKDPHTGVTTSTGNPTLLIKADNAVSLQSAAGATLMTVTSAAGVTVGSLSVGNTPASAGAIRLSNNTAINARNAGGTADLNLIGSNASDAVLVGATLTLAATLATLTGSLAIGATPATAGALRLSKASGINGLNNAGGANIALVTTDASDQVLLGDITNAVNTLVQASTTVQTKIGATVVATVAATGLGLGTNFANAGILSLPNATKISARNFLNTNNFDMLESTAGNYTLVGNNSTGLTLAGAGVALGFFGATGATKVTLAAAATDPATTQTLANSIRTMLITSYGMAA